MIRVTRHTAQKEHAKPCVFCETPILSGEEYRQLIGMDTDIWDKGFVRELAHDTCAYGSEAWELRDGTRPNRGTLDCAYVRERYGLLIRAGSRVIVASDGIVKHGTVRGASNHVYVHIDGTKKLRYEIHHPHNVTLAPLPTVVCRVCAKIVEGNPIGGNYRSKDRTTGVITGTITLAPGRLRAAAHLKAGAETPCEGEGRLSYIHPPSRPMVASDATQEVVA